MRIGNLWSLGIAVAFAAWSMTGLIAGTLLASDVVLAVACATGVLILGVLAFAAGALGGGDVKLLAVTSLFAGTTFLVDFLTVVAVVGGALGLALLVGVPIGLEVGKAGNVSIPKRSRRCLPYGPAIAAGGLWIASRLAGA
jgi:prepilin peptidase CpaA